MVFPKFFFGIGSDIVVRYRDIRISKGKTLMAYMQCMDTIIYMVGGDILFTSTLLKRLLGAFIGFSKLFVEISEEDRCCISNFCCRWRFVTDERAAIAAVVAARRAS
jgi:hypothetical protein